jgi:uncharacterized membrane protein
MPSPQVPNPDPQGTAPPPPRRADVELALSRLLTVGVISAAVVCLFGAVLLLHAHGHEKPGLSEYRQEPAALTSPLQVLRSAASLEPRAVAQLGVLLLILTPIARVAFSLVLFAIKRDGLYVLITLAVLAGLLAGLLGAAV